jgi:sporulation protein YlmC with PRC-barrel domain
MHGANGMVWDDTRRFTGAASGGDEGTARRPASNVSVDKSSDLLRAKEMFGFSFGSARVDIRGWAVYANDGRRIGSVESLFVDMRAKAVRYLGVWLHDETRATDAAHATHSPGGRVLVPVGTASRVDDGSVVLNALSSEQVDAAPRIPNRPVTRTDENATLRAYGMATWRDVSPADLYDGPNFDERRLFGERPTSR